MLLLLIKNLYKGLPCYRSYNKQKMLSNPPNQLQKLITNLLIDQRYKEAINMGLRSYQIKQFKLQNLQPYEVLSLHYLLQIRFYSRSQISSQSWYQNELRIFIWLLMGYCYLKQRSVLELNKQDWHFFSQIFNNRNPDDFQFQSLSILKKQTKFTKWTSDQVRHLRQIIQSQDKKNKWNYIAKRLYLDSNKQHFRTAKQCREYWINHLDPTPLKRQWSTSQDLQLVQAIKNVGKKWSQISKQLQRKRTQHMVKNRYLSLVQNQLKCLKQQDQKIPNNENIILYIEKRLRNNLQNVESTISKFACWYVEGRKDKVNSQQEFQSAEVIHQIRHSKPLLQQVMESQSTFAVQSKYKPIMLASYETNQSINNQELIQEKMDLNSSFCGRIGGCSILDIMLRDPNCNLQ